MSRRGRSLAFLLLAFLAAAAAAVIADGYGSSVARRYGPLRPVVALGGSLPAGRAIGPDDAAALVLRRVPERFVPADALASPAEAVGMVPRAPLSAGSYLLAGQLRPPSRRGAAAPGLGAGRQPVEISVAGAGALLASRPAPGGTRVDVVVTAEPGGTGPGRTYVAAAGVPLVALSPGVEGTAGQAEATLGLTRRQALRLIAAESFARGITLLPRG